MTPETRTKAAALVKYISDDSTIAAYLCISRDDVAAMRESPRRLRRNATDSSDSRIFTPKTECKSASSGMQEGTKAALDAMHGSKRLLELTLRAYSAHAKAKGIRLDQAMAWLLYRRVVA